MFIHTIALDRCYLQADDLLLPPSLGCSVAPPQEVTRGSDHAVVGNGLKPQMYALVKGRSSYEEFSPTSFPSSLSFFHLISRSLLLTFFIPSQLSTLHTINHELLHCLIRTVCLHSSRSAT